MPLDVTPDPENYNVFLMPGYEVSILSRSYSYFRIIASGKSRLKISRRATWKSAFLLVQLIILRVRASFDTFLDNRAYRRDC